MPMTSKKEKVFYRVHVSITKDVRKRGRNDGKYNDYSELVSSEEIYSGCLGSQAIKAKAIVEFEACMKGGRDAGQ